MPQIRIFNTDKFFYDSPNTGEADCICSRCRKMIKENEIPLRIAVSKEMLTGKDPKTGKEHEFESDIVNGLEFRLCLACVKKAAALISDKPILN